MRPPKRISEELAVIDLDKAEGFIVSLNVTDGLPGLGGRHTIIFRCDGRAIRMSVADMPAVRAVLTAWLDTHGAPDTNSIPF